MLVGILISAMAVLTFGGLPTAAYAAGTPIVDEAGLTTELSTSGSDAPITLGGSLTITAGSLVVARTATLDLAGYQLYAKNIHLNPSMTLTIVDSSIGGGGSLHAFSNTAGVAGITTTGATLVVTSGSVVAGGGTAAVGIGGDTGDAGGTVVIGAAGSVTAAAGDATTSAIGGTSFGSLQVDGNLTLQSAELTIPAGVTVTGTGTITSWTHITNNGAILPTIAGNQQVSGNNFWISLDSNYPGGTVMTVHVFGPTLQASGAALLAPDRGPNVSVASWNSSADGTGTSFTATSALTANAQYYAQWQTSGITAIAIDYYGSPADVPAGTTGLSATYSAGAGTWDISDLVTFTSDVLDDDIFTDSYGAGITAELVGPRTITGTLNSNPTVKGTVGFTVVHGVDIGDIALTMNPTTVPAGGSSIAYLSAVDFYGNSFGNNLVVTMPCDWCHLTLSSSDPTDVIDQTTGKITFTTLGKHTITAELSMGEGGTVEKAAVVTVVAAPSALAATGYESTPAPWAATLLVALGLAFMVRRRRRRA